MQLIDIKNKNFTIVQALYRDPMPKSERYPAGWTHRSEYWVADHPLKSVVAPIADEFLTGLSDGDALHEIWFYPRSYKDRARDCLRTGRVIHTGVAHPDASQFS